MKTEYAKNSSDITRLSHKVTQFKITLFLREKVLVRVSCFTVEKFKKKNLMTWWNFPNFFYEDELILWICLLFFLLYFAGFTLQYFIVSRVLEGIKTDFRAQLQRKVFSTQMSAAICIYLQCWKRKKKKIKHYKRNRTHFILIRFYGFSCVLHSS